MKYKNFAIFVDSFSDYKLKTGTTIKPFLKTYRQTYGQLQRRAYKSANYLQGQGIKKGDRVMVVASNCPQWQELFLGCQLIGAILVPVDARNSLDVVIGFARQTEPKLVFRSKFILPKLDKKMKAKILEDYEDIIDSYSEEKPKVGLSGDEESVIIFTSGTTAAPKGVVLTQRNILSNVEGVVKAIDIDSNWRILSVLPLSHSYELTGECCMLSRGVSIYYLPKITPLAIAKGLNEYKITTLLAVPQLLALFKQRIMQTAALEGQDKILNIALKVAPSLPKPIKRLIFGKVHRKLGGHLKIVVTGGAPIPLEVGHFWENMGVRALQGYGLTETAPILTVNKLNDHFRDSQGKALHTVELKVAEDGEILAQGPGIFKGYWQNPEQTKQAFTNDGWFKTGDMGKIDNEGWLKIQGRAKFMIVLPSGLNVFPEDIELVGEKHPYIKEICVVGVKTDQGEEVFAAIASDKSDKKIKKAIQEINEKLEDFQYISNWARWPEEQFPRTLLLKIDRKTVQAWANNESKAEQKNTSKNKASNDPIISILRSSLDDQNIQISEKDRLADVGIDSLRRMAVVSMIEEQLGVSIPEAKIEKTTTLGDLRKLVQSGNHAQKATKFSTWQLTRPARIFGDILRSTVIRVFLRIFVTIKIEGQENLNGLKTPAIFIFNHVDNLDGMVVFQSLPRWVSNNLTVAQAEDFLQKHPIIKIGSRICYGAYNFNRTNNVMPSLEQTIKLIDDGWNVLLAPEGKVATSDKMQKFKSGVGLLAVESGVPIVPVKIKGLFGTLPLHAKMPKKHSTVTVKIGQPICIDRHESYDSATKKLYKLMKKL